MNEPHESNRRTTFLLVSTLLGLWLFLTVMLAPHSAPPPRAQSYAYVTAAPTADYVATCAPNSRCAFRLFPGSTPETQLIHVYWDIQQNNDPTVYYYDAGIKILSPALDADTGIELSLDICLNLSDAKAIRLEDIRYSGSPVPFAPTRTPNPFGVILPIQTQTPLNRPDFCMTATSVAAEKTATAQVSTPTWVPTATPISTATTSSGCANCTATPYCPTPGRPCGCATAVRGCDGCPGGNEEYLVDFGCYGCGYGNFSEFRDQTLNLSVATSLHGFFKGTPEPTGAATLVYDDAPRWQRCDDSYATPVVTPPPPGGNSSTLDEISCPAVRHATPASNERCLNNCGLRNNTNLNIAYLRDLNPDTMLHEMFHQWRHARYSDEEWEQVDACARPIIERWMSLCRFRGGANNLTPPPGPSGPDTYRLFCQIWYPKAVTYKDNNSSTFIEEALASIAGLAASCDRLDCSTWLPPELLGFFQGFLDCAKDATPSPCLP